MRREGDTYVHGDAEHHEFSVEADQRLVLSQAVLLHEPNLDGAQEVPIQSCVDKENQDLGDLVPDVVDLDKGLAHGGNRVRRDPDTEDGDVDGADDDQSAPFEVADGAAVLGDEGNSVDDDLHEELDLECPEEEDEEEDWDTIVRLVVSSWERLFMSVQNVRWSYPSI